VPVVHGQVSQGRRAALEESAAAAPMSAMAGRIWSWSSRRAGRWSSCHGSGKNGCGLLPAA